MMPTRREHAKNVSEACSGNSNSGIILCRFSKDWVDVQEKVTVLKSAFNGDINMCEEISNDGPL